MDSCHGYQIRRRLGFGGGGIVFSGIRKSDNLRVAIKIIKGKGLKKTTSNGVPTEISLLKRAQTVPGIIKVVEHFRRFGNDILVMEQFGTSDLFDWIFLNGPSDDHIARHIFKQVVKIIEECFNQGIVHGDIKDENILINHTTLEIKIIDFGEGMIVDGRPFRKFHGTLVHSPPEWFNSWEFAQEPWTVWTLGVLLFTLILGKYPFEELDVAKTNPFSNPLWNSLKRKDKNLQTLVHQYLALNPC